MRTPFTVLRIALVSLLPVSLSLVACTATGPKSADVSGTWVATQASPMGEMEFVLRLKQDREGNLTGTVSSPIAEGPIQHGRLEGNALQLTAQTESFGTLQDRTFTATLSGSELHINASSLLPNMPSGGGPPMGPTGAGGAESPPAGAPPEGMPAMTGLPPMSFNLDDLVAQRREPKPTFRAPPVDYKTLPAVELPAIRDLATASHVARTPPMGWNSWNGFHTDISDVAVRGVADAMVSSGMRDAGYLYINIDDGWQGKRDAHGVLQPNPHFPDMKALADYVHSKGLKLGLYSSPGPRTCGGYEGSYGHEELDARTWAAWGIDYLKYDWCTASRVWTNADMRAAYQIMGEALQKSGREIIYSLCQYGLGDVDNWGPLVGGNLWRTTSDIFDNWNSMLGNASLQDSRAPNAGPGRWNDPDMLEVGNGGMTPTEYRTHFSLWAVIAAPLIAGNDLRNMDGDTRTILLNSEVIAVNQDVMGVQGRRVARQGDVSVWLRPLAGNAYALALVNEAAQETSASVKWADLQLPANLKARDLWSRQDLGVLANGFSGRIPSHGVALLKLQR